jgi:hypothetical protein
VGFELSHVTEAVSQLLEQNNQPFLLWLIWRLGLTVAQASLNCHSIFHFLLQLGGQAHASAPNIFLSHNLFAQVGLETQSS